MNEVLVATCKDLRRYARDPIALLLWLGVPLLIGALLITAMGGTAGPAPQVHLLIADEDDSWGSRLLVSGLVQGDSAQTIRAERVDATAGRARLDRGDGSALLIIPSGFVAAMLDDKPAQLQLITNPAQRILPGIAKELLDILREAVFYAHRLMGPEIRQIADRVTKGESGFSDVELSLLSVSMGQKFRRLERCLSPRLIELETVAAAAPSSAPAAAVPLVFYFLPGMLLMGLLFTAQGISDDIWREREQGILRRVVTTPYGVTWFLVGKVLAATAIAALVAAIVLAAGMAYFQLPARRWPLAVVWTTGLGVLFTTVMFAIQVFASSHRGASVLSLVVVFPLMMLGGSMFPLEIMPPWLAAIGRWTPNGWGNEQLTAILLGREAPYPHLVAFALLSASVTLCLLVAGTRLARTFARS